MESNTEWNLKKIWKIYKVILESFWFITEKILEKI